MSVISSWITSSGAIHVADTPSTGQNRSDSVGSKALLRIPRVLVRLYNSGDAVILNIATAILELFNVG